MKKKVLLGLLLGYLLLLTVLTICSNFFLLASLPRVSVQSASAGYLQKSYYNDMVVAEAVFYDEKNQSYVLTVNTKSTPLGDRQYVSRVPVVVLAMNRQEGYAAIQGAIGQNSRIVCRTTRKLQDGEAVVVE